MDTSSLIELGMDTANRLNELEVEPIAATVIVNLCAALEQSEAAKQRALDDERVLLARRAELDIGGIAGDAMADCIRARIGKP